MIGDVLLFKDRHNRCAESILEAFKKLDVMRPILAISGESGSGKSEIAHLLRVELGKLGKTSKIIHTDNYYRTSPAERTKWREAHGVENCVGPDEYHWGKINEALDAFRSMKEEVSLPFLDIVTLQEDRLITSFKEIDVLILEGLYAIKADADLRALIDLTYHDTKDAQVLRGKEPQNQFRTRVLEAEHRAVSTLRETVDLILTKEIMGM